MKKIILFLFALTFTLASCSDDDEVRLLQRDDVIIKMPQQGWVAEMGKPFIVEVECDIDQNMAYRWFLVEDNEGNIIWISSDKNLNYTFKRTGSQILRLVASQGSKSYEYNISVTVEGKETPDGKASPYITDVLEYVPAPGQYTNRYPFYAEGDTPMDMCNKVLDAIGNGNLGVVTLGAYGGYVVLGFDHTIKNVVGKRDFRVLGNVNDYFENASTANIGLGGAEPGIVMVAYDKNENGRPDSDEWYEIEGSAHKNFQSEPWYDDAARAHNDLETVKDYEITYYVPEKEPELDTEWLTYLKWKDNLGMSGYIVKNGYHSQSYYPQWVMKDQLIFKGTRLPQNAIDKSGVGTLFYGYNFSYGYADNAKNDQKAATFDIDWAVDKDGNKVDLPGVDFIKIYTGVRQRYGMLGECSTEISGIEDLHVLGEDIDTATK